jgi:signal transduction histidine kinase
MIRRFGIPLVVLLSSLFLTFVATWVIATGAAERDEARFANAVESTRDRLEQRLDLYVALLRAGVGMFAVTPEVGPEQFRTFIDRIDVAQRYPGIQGIGFTRRFAPAELEALQAERRANGVPDFRVWPEQERAEYHSIVYLEPLDVRNTAALGYDMYTEPVRRSAMERARDTGEPVLSGRVTLVQEIDDRTQAGFLIYAPVYRGGFDPGTLESRREALLGYVYAPFRADDLFMGIFGRERQPRVAFDIYDGDRLTPEALLYTSRFYGTEPVARSPFADTVSIEFAGQPWTLVFTPTTAFDLGSRRHLVPLFGGLGVVLSVILFGLALLEGRATHRAQQHARRAEGFSRQVGEQAAALEAQVQEVRALNEELAAANDELVLTHRAAEQARRDAEAARAQADEANRAKSQFLATMSHELRTPLNAIAGYVDLLELGLRGPLNEQQLADLDRIRRAQQHLLGHVDDVLNFAKIEVGRVRYTLEPVTVETVLLDLDNLVVPLAQAKRIAFRRESADPGLRVSADREKMLQILLNLLANAIKFTPPGGQVSVQSRRLDGGVSISVEDTGQGIPPERIHAVFEPFVQISTDLTRVNQGTGLGLAIAHELATGMGGALSVQSEVGAGSRFTLWLRCPDGGEQIAAEA